MAAIDRYLSEIIRAGKFGRPAEPFIHLCDLCLIPLRPPDHPSPTVRFVDSSSASSAPGRGCGHSPLDVPEHGFDAGLVGGVCGRPNCWAMANEELPGAMRAHLWAVVGPRAATAAARPRSAR
jgi:hypothetical protein